MLRCSLTFSMKLVLRKNETQLSRFSSSLVSAISHKVTKQWYWTLHNLQITTSPTKSFPACSVFISRFLVMVSNKGYFSASVLKPRTESTSNYQLTSLPQFSSFITPRHGPRRQHHSFWYANCFSLPREYVYRAVAQKRFWYNRPSLDRCIATAIQATVLFINVVLTWWIDESHELSQCSQYAGRCEAEHCVTMFDFSEQCLILVNSVCVRRTS
jgi:hypothetical protein